MPEALETVTRQEAAYDQAAGIADKLLALGIPVIGFGDDDLGRRVRVTFQLHDAQAKYVARVPVEAATFERFLELYEAVK